MNTFREWIESHGISQRYVAKHLKVSPPTLHAILNDGLKPSLNTAYRIEVFTAGIVKMRDWLDKKLYEDTPVISIKYHTEVGQKSKTGPKKKSPTA